jgi:hypothetical protein
MELKNKNSGGKCMVKITYVESERFTKKGKLKKSYETYLNRISDINEIIAEYLYLGYMITLRQLYYQLVTKNIIPNEPREYSALSRLLKKGRMEGDVDWAAIEDRLRVPKLPYSYLSVANAIRDTAECYRIDRQIGQSTYIEVWVEKDAISGILYEITRDYHVRLMVNRGYSSCTAMEAAARRFKEHIEKGKNCVILYLGDHDPSGEDMVRDIRERLIEFGVTDGVEVRKIGLTWEQIQEYQPPENKLKKKGKKKDAGSDFDAVDGEFRDPRGLTYFEKYGDRSWEVDALRPDVLDKLVRGEIESLIDMSMFEFMKRSEAQERAQLFELAETAKMV